MGSYPALARGVACGTCDLGLGNNPNLSLVEADPIALLKPLAVGRVLAEPILTPFE